MRRNAMRSSWRTSRLISSLRIICAPYGRKTVTVSIGRSGPSKDHFVVAWDVTMVV